jgi:hypothetical protein
LYFNKGSYQIPDPSNFDGLIKQETRVILNNFSIDTSKGLILAIYLHHSPQVDLHYSVSENHFVMLNAAAKPAPAPLYNLPKPDPVEDYSDNFISDM